MGIFKVRDSKIYDSVFKKFYQKENQDRILLKKKLKNLEENLTGCKTKQF